MQPTGTKSALNFCFAYRIAQLNRPRNTFIRASYGQWRLVLAILHNRIYSYYFAEPIGDRINAYDYESN